MDKMIYLDHAATTAVKPEVLSAMLPYFTQQYGNPSSIYEFAADSRHAMEQARQIIADSLGTDSSTIFFTAGGSEADNWAIKAVAEQYRGKGKHIITSKMEHHAVLHTCEYLERQGYEVTYLDVDEQGIIKLPELEHAIRPDTILISIMYANNEVGTIQPIREIGKIAHRHGILFHTDAVQAYGQIPIEIEEEQIDLLSASGHKLGAPKGVGFLYIRDSEKLTSFIHGGGQERKLRAGTENVPGIVGMGKAAELAIKSLQEREQKVGALKDYLVQRVLSEVPFVRLNGDKVHRLPGNANFSFQFIEGETLLIMLDMKGICASSGSACTTGDSGPSHVLLAMGLPPEIAYGSLRLTLGEENTKEEIDYVVDCIREIVEKLRSMSPEYEAFLHGDNRL